MTVRENLSFGLRIRKLSDDVVARRVSTVADSLGLTPLLERNPRSSPAASVSASRSAARSCASRGPFCSTSRSRTSTRGCAWKRAPSCRACTDGSARR
jgi:hypothetical protein